MIESQINCINWFPGHSIKQSSNFIRFIKYSLITSALGLALGLVSLPLHAEQRDPEAGSGLIEKKAVVSDKFMVVAANPYASEAGYRILKKGGSAIDAAIAVQAMLTLVEPQSSGIGGGSFILHWNKKQQQLQTYDGRETAPKAVTSDLFLQANKQPMRWMDAVVGGKAVGVPGVLKALHLAHQQHGKLPWSSLFEYTIELADSGFMVSKRMQTQILRQMNPGITKLKASVDYFFPQGQVVQVGELKTNKPLAAILRQISQFGVDAFYQGKNAKAIVDAVNNSPINPGLLSLKDLTDYKAKERAPLCAPYHQYRICGMGPPSSGGFTVLQMLALLEPFELKQYQPNQVEAVHLYTQASRLAYADRNRYAADSDFVNVPFQQLLNPQYLKQRVSKIKLDKDMGRATPGLTDVFANQGHDNAIELPSTSHFSIVDATGNAISMTTSIEHAFGSAIMVNGYLLNNQLTDFSFNPSQNGKLVANRIQPNKRPRSSMSPMMVFDKQGQLKMVIGSPGGSRIINYVAQTLVAVLDWKMDIQQAINLPKVTNRNGITTLESETNLVNIQAALEKKRHQVRIRTLNSGLHGIVLENGKLIGGADPRREGIGLGL